MPYSQLLALEIFLYCKVYRITGDHLYLNGVNLAIIIDVRNNNYHVDTFGKLRSSSETSIRAVFSSLRITRYAAETDYRPAGVD